MLKWLKKIFVTRQDLNRSDRDSWRNFCSLLVSTASELGLISTADLLKIKNIFKSVHSFTLPSARFISSPGCPLERLFTGLFKTYISWLSYHTLMGPVFICPLEQASPSR